MSDFLSLTNLRIIRGQSLYKYNGMEFSLFVSLNYDPKNSSLGLKELQFVSLHGRLFLFLHLFHTLKIICYVLRLQGKEQYIYTLMKTVFSGLLFECLLWNKKYACMRLRNFIVLLGDLCEALLSSLAYMKIIN